MASALLKFVDTHLGLDVASPSRVRLIASDPRVSETGSHGAVEIRRQGSLAEQASGKLIVSGTATEGSDYAPIDKSWTLAKGQASLVIDIEPLADDELEGPETIRFDLAEVKGSHPVDKTTALLHIADAARPAAWIDSAQDAVEGASPIAFTVVRDSCAAPLSVTLDYGPSAPDGAPTTVDFAQGEVRKDVAIDLPVDGLATGRRRLTVAAAPGDGYAPGPWSGTLWIEDADLDTDLARWWRLQLSDSAVVEHTAGVDGAAYPSSSGPVATKAMAKEAFDALAFDGVDDVLILKPPTLGPVFSVALAFRADSAAPPNAYQYLWSHGKVTYRNSLNIYLTSSGTLRTGLRGADDDWVYNALQPSGDWRDDTWHHYALCVENGAAKVYLDGALKVSASLGAGGLSPNTHIVVGARVDLHVDRHFQGQLADVRIYQRALAPADVAAIAAPYAP